MTITSKIFWTDISERCGAQYRSQIIVKKGTSFKWSGYIGDMLNDLYCSLSNNNTSFSKYKIQKLQNLKLYHCFWSQYIYCCCISSTSSLSSEHLEHSDTDSVEKDRAETDSFCSSPLSQRLMCFNPKNCNSNLNVISDLHNHNLL